ncbi:MAG: hypothetical protein KAW56_00985 [Candidatus Marinimicrobia bacterium]|nr:hypothetical protein [Candidatus Neomarinimicrobiota bacterium]
MNIDVVRIALFVGLILGSLMLIVACWVYLKHQKLGLGGITFSMLGVVLLGMSIWQQVEFSVGTAKFKAIAQHIDDIETKYDSTMKEIAKIKTHEEILMDKAGLISSSFERVPKAQSHLININRTRISKIQTSTDSIRKYIGVVEANDDEFRRSLTEVKRLIGQ